MMIEDNKHEGKIGLVLGNGHSVNWIEDYVLTSIRNQNVISCGVNRTGIARRLIDLNLYTTYNLIWDPAIGILNSTKAEIEFSLQRIKGKTIRVGIKHVCNLWDNDIWLAGTASSYTSKLDEGLKPGGTVVTAAVQLLYKLGIREIYLVGADYYGSHHEMIEVKCEETNEYMMTKTIKVKIPKDKLKQLEQSRYLWSKKQGADLQLKVIQEQLPELKLFCLNSLSELVVKNIVKYKPFPIL